MNILYVGNIGEKDTALSIHTRNIAKLLTEMGHSVSFVCERRNIRNIYSDDIYTYHYTREDIRIPKIRALSICCENVLGFKIYDLLKRIAKEHTPDIVILYGMVGGQKQIINFCKKNKIKVIAERVDWFSKEDRDGFIDKQIYSRYSDMLIRSSDLQLDGVISISEFFHDYYTELGKKSILIPPIFDMSNEKLNYKKDHPGLKLVYAGSIGGKKDLLLPLLYAIRTINRHNAIITLNVVGVTYQQIEKMTKFNEDYSKKIGIIAHGRKSNVETKHIIRQSDFSVLFRRNKRYAKAGFSTKFAESMCCGVPVICTKVGGPDRLIKDMVTGVLIDDNSESTICNCLKKLLMLDDNLIEKMHTNAYSFANNYFDYRNYYVPFSEFLNEL